MKMQLCKDIDLIDIIQSDIILRNIEINIDIYGPKQTWQE